MINSLRNHCWVRRWKNSEISQHLPKLWARMCPVFESHGVNLVHTMFPLLCLEAGKKKDGVNSTKYCQNCLSGTCRRNINFWKSMSKRFSMQSLVAWGINGKKLWVPMAQDTWRTNATDLPNLYVVDEPQFKGSLFCHRNIHNWIWYTDLQ